MIGLLICGGEAPDALGLVNALTWANLTAVYSSPLGLAIQTAQPLARDHGLDVKVRPALADIEADEPPQRMQQRVVDELLALSRSHPGEVVAVVTHAGPIRCALAAFGLGSHDAGLAVEIMPSHVTAVGFEPTVSRVLSVNVPADQLAV